MAVVYAYESTDMLSFNFNRVYSGSYSYEISKDIIFNYIVYPDVLEIDWEYAGYDNASYFGGYNLSYKESGGGLLITGGTATGYIETYFDGSAYHPFYLLERLSISAVDLFNAFVSPSTDDDFQIIEQAMSGPDSLYGSAFQDTLAGYDDIDVLWGNEGDDALIGGRGNDIINGGLGVDTSYYAQSSVNYAITVDRYGFVVFDKAGVSGRDQLAHIEKVAFSSDPNALDITYYSKTATLTEAQITSLVELYIASFNRAPDSSGLNYWGGRLADGMSLPAIAKSFFEQPETQKAYPTNLGNEYFINTVYQNVLGRSPDQEGMNYWLADLNSGAVSKDLFLLAIINAANSTTGGPNDKQTLQNKTFIGGDYALNEGLNNVHWAKDVMSGVTYNAATVSEASLKVDDYGARAASLPTTELTVSTVGGWEFLL